MYRSLPLQLPTMTFSNIVIKRQSSVKFLGVIIDENLTWKNHIQIVENKISKNIGVPYRASHLLDFKTSKTSLPFAFTSVMLIFLGLVLLKLNFRESKRNKNILHEQLFMQTDLTIRNHY